METAKDFPITTRYGWIKGYPLHTSPYDPSIPLLQRKKYPGKGYGFHTGVDRVMPVGTPVKVTNTVIGNSGVTGYTTGPHLHIGRYLGGVSDPKDGGFNFALGAKVLDTGQDPINGRYVRIRSRFGIVYVYLHLSKISVKAGDKIK